MTSSRAPPPGHTPPEQSLIECPSDFPIKVMGPMHDGFAATIVEVARLRDPEFHEGRLKERPSSSGSYLGLTVAMRVASREQLDALYQTLMNHPMVKTML